MEIPHFGSMRGQERELILLRSENGETWKEHLYDCKTDDLNQLLNGMDEGEKRVLTLFCYASICSTKHLNHKYFSFCFRASCGKSKRINEQTLK